MAAKTVSPGAALLRSSRLFSMPSPLPPAPGDVSGASRYGSATATLPYPTHQAIASPKASRKRGDWGLKRSLPGRMTSRSTQPAVRIKELDALERITDYAMAGDHVVTLRKWQDMQVPITLQTDAEQRQHLPGKSVFEESADMISLEDSKKHTAQDKRWKFQGPWLAGITDGAFQGYLAKQVRPRRSEFREFLRKQLAEDESRLAAAEAMDDGKEAPAPIEPSAISDAKLTEYLRELRHSRPLLYRLVGKFLDLAPLQPSDKIFQNLVSRAPAAASETGGALGGAGSSQGGSAFLSLFGRPGENGAANPWAQDGPPITHPSAGLSYLRSSAYLDNHPLYGPQKVHPPVQARIVAPRSTVGSQPAKLGVAGFIAENPFSEATFNTHHTSGIPGLTLIDPKVKGGAKVPVRVSTAKVNSQGRVIVNITEADPEAVLVQKELAGEGKIFGQPGALQSTRRPTITRRYSPATGPLSRNRPSTVISSPQTYGLGP